MSVDEGFRVEVDVVSSLIDQMDYFQLLKVERNATPGEVQASFFRESRAFHPDRYFGVADPTFSAQVLNIYKRLAEAYGTLKEPEARAFYIQQLERGGPLRLDRRQFEASQRQASVPEAAATTVNGRKYLALGLECMKRNDFKAASLHFQLALSAEPGNQAIKDHLQAARDKAAGRG